MIVHDTHKRPATISKYGEKKVLVNGICAWGTYGGSASTLAESRDM